ncbi:MAG: DUF305 domain-containing protein [Burkholderiaceae bacterium]|nr:DUF305 domain-containing protein [Microbacteriaceae bacterium]
MTDQVARTPHGRGRLIVAAVLAGLLLLGGGLAIGRLTAPNPALTPTTTSAEAGFARDMQVHHLQAVEMAHIIRDASSNADIRLLAYDIANLQAQQAGQMYGWLASWGLSQAAPEPSMTWMTRPALDGSAHDHAADDASHTPGEPMPGLATFEQMAQLRAATGTDADRLFLTLMIAHHRGGIEMANALLDRSTSPVVTPLARGIVMAQQSEIDYMAELLGS